jgi:hypothetical protein
MTNNENQGITWLGIIHFTQSRRGETG